MSYQRIQPPAALSDIVEYFGIQQSEEVSDAVTHVLPTTHNTLLVHFGDRFIHHVNGEVQLEPVAHVCGQRTHPYSVSAAGKTGIVICSFFPWGIYELTGTPLGPLANTSVDATEVFPSVRPTIQRMLEAENNKLRIQHLISYLSGLEKRQCALARHAANILQRNCIGSMEKVATHLGLSKRHLDRHFIEAVGISPKMFSRVLRFQKAMSYRLTDVSTATIAANCGYYDQAHMHRELRLLGGQTPRTLFDRADTTPLLSQFNANPPQKSRFYNTLYLL